jgi:hypothetical protein
MNKIVSAFFQRPRSLGPSLVRAQSSHTIPRSPAKSISHSSSAAKHSRREPANPQPKPFFHRWLDAWKSQTWKSQNGGDHGQSR